MPVMTEVGMCLTFNSKYARFQFMLQDLDWHQTELHKCHYHSGQCYVRIDSLNNGVRVRIINLLKKGKSLFTSFF